jgi:hypothetical protein
VEDRRIRYSTTLQRHGMFRDEPDLLKAFADADVPLALAMRSFDAFYASKARDVSKKLNTAGYTSQEESVANRSPYETTADTYEGRLKELNDKAPKPEEEGGVLGWFANRVADVGSGAAWLGEKAVEGATWTWNRAVQAPLSAGYATDSPVDDGLQWANEGVDRIPVIGGVLSLGLGLTEGIVNYAEGLGRLGAGVQSDEQRQDIKNAGLNPDRLGDRINHYSQDFGEVRAPVTDEHIEQLKGYKRWSPEDVDAAREIVTTGAVEDLARAFPALSPQAQDLVLRASTDPKAEELLGAVGDMSQDSLGYGILKGFMTDKEQEPGQWFGPNSPGRAITSAALEVIVTWQLDPTVLATKGYQAVRAARYGLALQPANRLDEATRMLAASDDNYAPKGAVAKRFDQAMETADEMVRVGLDTPAAAKLRASWNRKYVGYDKTLDLLVGQRTGNVGQVRARTVEEALPEARKAAETGRDIQPWVLDSSGDGKPLWRYTNDDGTKLTAEQRAAERAKVAEELSTFILMDAAASGREITGSRLLLPGQLSINGAIRDKIAPVLEAFNRRDKSVMKQLREVGKKPLDLDGHLVADEAGRWDTLVSPEASEWYRNNYTFGITHMYSRGWRAFEKTFSNKVIVPSSPDSVKVFGQLVSQFMPRRQAQMMTTMYAGANPAERWAMTRQTMGSLLNVMNLRNTPESQKIVDQLTKGLVPQGEYINGYKSGPREYYTTPDGNYIRVGDLKMPAAVHPWQLSEGFELPNWRELRGLSNRNWLLNAVTRTSDGQTANALVRAWKSSKVTTWSNMFRQGLELAVFSAWRDPKVLGEYRKARKAVKSDVLNRKVADHDLERLANSVNNLNPDDLAMLENVRRAQPERYVNTVASMLQKEGYNPGAAEVMARLSQDVDLQEYGELLASGSERKVRHLAMIGPLDRVRKVRAARAERKGGNLEDTPLDEHLDAELAQLMLEGAAKQFGSAAESYAWNMAERSTHVDRRRITDAAGRNISFRPVKIVNGYEWADTNPHLWAAELGRRQSDPVGKMAIRLIAKKALANVDESRRVSALPPRAAEEVVEEVPTGVNLPPFTATADTDHVYDAVRAIESRTGGWVPLDKVRSHLAGLSREQVDEALKALDALPEVRIINEVNQKALTESQRAAALHVGGSDMHLIQIDKSVLDAPKTLPERPEVTKRRRVTAPAPEIRPDLDAQVADELAVELADLGIGAERFKNADDLMTHLYGEHELGASMRANGAALQYLPNGKPVRNPADRMAAAQHAAQRAVNDLVHHMGGKVTRIDGKLDIQFPDEAEPLLRKLSAGEELSAKELGELPAQVRPDGMVAPIYAPMIPEKQGFTRGLSNLATRAYGAVVADPLDKLFIMPAFTANRRIAQDELSPLMQGLIDKGMKPEQAAFMVEAAVNRRAVARTFQGTDNPMEKSVFSEMADKWLMFQRAQEDFLRRLVNATRANPEGLARANILMQAGVHTGIVHYEPFQDEEGNTEHHLTFTYPGTALAQRVLADAFAGLGLAPDEILRVPQFDGLKSQVRFLNPGFSNPLQFSANPIFGMTMTAAEKIWPSATVELERLKRGFAGGADFEGTEGPFSLKNMLPSMFSRFAVFASKDDADGQFQSAMRAALMYAEAAGLTPEADASPAERSRYLDAVKATTTNIMIQRAVFGTFLPAAPQVADPDGIDVDILARLQGLPNLRAEFFDIRNELAQKYPDNFFRADSEAVMEFARRYPGELIVNPAAFSTGSTKVAGVDEGYVPYTIEATRWLFENQEFARGNPTLAIALMPKSTADGDFSNEAYKLQLKSDIRTHKDIEEFYLDVTLSNDLDEYYSTRSRYFAAAKQQPSLEKSVYAKLGEWEDGWIRSHPLAAAELNRRSNPDFVHGEIAPGLGRLADGTDPLPENLASLRPQINEMWADYQEYREAYMKVSFYDNAGRSKLNSQYQRQGDIKWLGTPLSGLSMEDRQAIESQSGQLSGLWNLMRVTEGR